MPLSGAPAENFRAASSDAALFVAVSPIEPLCAIRVHLPQEIRLMENPR
jgi:hypothetical protein